jgi:ComF family protein
MRDIVHFFKYRDKPMLAGVLAQAMAEYAVANRRALNELEFDMIVPVPMYPPKERRRGYNQARRLAEGIGRRLSICIADRSTLRRTRDAKPQMELPREARLVNVKGVYEAAASVSGLTVLLIDDVSTTGATLKECSATLKAAGAAKVYCLTLAAG